MLNLFPDDETEKQPRGLPCRVQAKGVGICSLKQRAPNSIQVTTEKNGNRRLIWHRTVNNSVFTSNKLRSKCAHLLRLCSYIPQYLRPQTLLHRVYAAHPAQCPYDTILWSHLTKQCRRLAGEDRTCAHGTRSSPNIFNALFGNHNVN